MTVRHRLSEVGARVGWFSLCLVPVSIGIGRFWPIYVAPSNALATQYHSVSLYPADALVAATCLGWLAWRGLSRRPWRLPNGTALPIAAVGLLAVAAAASLTATYDRRLTLAITAQLALLVLFCVAAVDLVAHFPRRLLLTVVALAVLGEAVLAAWQAASQTTAPAGLLFNGWATELTSQTPSVAVVILPAVGRWLRSYGSFAHPNILGGYLSLALGVLMLGNDPRVRRLCAVAVAAGVIAVVLSVSRTAGLALLLGGATSLLAARGGRVHLAHASRRARLGAGIALVLLGLVALVRLGNPGALVERNSIETRLTSYAVTWELIVRDIPVGAGNHVLVERELFGGGGPAHDVFLIALAELGPLGLAAWLAVFGSLLYLAWQRRADPRWRSGPLIAVATLFPLLLFDHYLWTLPPGRVLAVWALALLISLSGEDAPSTSSHVRMLALKRGVDTIAASAALVALAPVLAFLAIAVWCDSRTPVLFRAERLGRAGRPFTMYKFRTMANGSETALMGLRSQNVAQGMVKIAGDPRVTPIGRWLRRFSLDELPQLWNVVRGDMSLVGPRPHQLGEVSPDDPVHRERLAIRPGLTGLWQVSARTNPSLAVRVQYDLDYILRWSPLLDLAIVLRTIPVVLRGEGGQVRCSEGTIVAASTPFHGIDQGIDLDPALRLGAHHHMYRGYGEQVGRISGEARRDERRSAPKRVTGD